jgi:DNA-binding phage protein
VGLRGSPLSQAALAPGAKPRYDTVLKVLHSLGVKLTVSAG